VARQHMSITEERALQLLGSGVSSESVAAALGVDASRISQLLAEPEFREEVEQLRFTALQKHNAMDDKYDALEDKLLVKLEKSIPMLFKPGEILGAIRVINGAKRRGQSAAAQIINQQNIVQLTLPTQIVNNFTTNINNQVIRAGEQDLVTIQSGTLLDRAKNKHDDTRSISQEEWHADTEALPGSAAGG